MTPERWQRVKELCDLALERDPRERNAFVAERCRDDAELRHDVETRLAQATGGEGVLDAPTCEKPGLTLTQTNPGDGPSVRWLPEAVGSYRVLRLVGEGGMGTVYEAEQDHPRRTVALKVIRPGLTSPELLRRFERESQALGRLQHPGIAQIYEAGTADTGFGPQPYFAMEFIRGERLREYADAHQLTTRQRLELFARICDAVEHAHQRGLIHRDLKPGNILVDEIGQPKILDFGVARLTDSDAQATRQTDLGQLVGTLAYMSPEQVLADPLELDTRSDVYALGVILYELLAGRLPYTISNKLHEAVRTIREEDPGRLSSISRTYRGDIETIVAKALEKDKERRYASAAALAEDIRRYLAHEPIAARPASTTYQLEKFARRHRALVVGVAAVFVVLLAGVVVSAWQAVRARRAERAAVEAEQTAQALNDFLQNDLLAQASASRQGGPNQKPDPDLKVRTALDRAAARILGRFDRQPEVEAAIRYTIGQTYIELGLYADARKQLEQALDLQRRVLGAENPKTLSTIGRLGQTAFLQGKYPEAEALLGQALEVQRRVLGSEHPDTLNSMGQLGNVYYWEGKYAQSETIISQSLEIRRRIFGLDSPETVRLVNGLASAYHALGKYAQAEALFSQAVEIDLRLFGPEHPDTLGAMNNRALNYVSQGKYAEAEALDTQILESRRRVLGPEHPDTLGVMNNLAIVYTDQGKREQAKALYSQALEAQRRVLGSEHLMTLRSMNNLAGIYNAEGKHREAEALYSQTLEIERRVLGAEHDDTLISMNNLANARVFQGKYAPSETLYSDALAISRRVLGSEHPLTLAIFANAASMYQRQGKYALAEASNFQILAGRRRVLGPEHPDTMESVAELALACLSQRKFTESEPLAREALEFTRKKQVDDWQRFRAESLLGASLAGQKKYAEAEPLLVEGYQEMAARKERMSVPDWYYLDRACEWLVQLYQDWGKPDRAAEWRQRQKRTNGQHNK